MRNTCSNKSGTWCPEPRRGEAHLLRKRSCTRSIWWARLALIAEEMEKVQEARNVRTFHALHERVARVVRHNPCRFCSSVWAAGTAMCS